MKKSILYLCGICMAFFIIFIAKLNGDAAELGNGKCGDNVSYSFNASTGVLRIYGTGEMYDNEGYSPFNSNQEITTVVVEEGVTYVGQYAFEDCGALTEIKFADSVREIGVAAFDYCTSLKNVTTGKGLEIIGPWAFSQCEELKTFTFKNPDSIKIIGAYAFADCYKLKSIKVGNRLESIGENAFRQCFELEAFSMTNPSSLKEIGDYAFLNSSLDEFKIGKNVAYIGKRAFMQEIMIMPAGCTKEEEEKLLDKNVIRGLNLYVHRDNSYAINVFKKIKCDKYILYPKETPKVTVKAKKGKIVVRFNKIKNAKKYYIVVKQGKTQKTFTTKKLKYTIRKLKSGLKKGKVYKIKVRAKLVNNQYTKYSKTIKVKAK